MIEKKKLDPNPTGMKLFWRIQGELWRRMVMPFLMYLFMGIVMLAVQAISPDSVTPLEIGLGIVCLIVPILMNAHLLFLFGKDHFDHYLTGEMQRRLNGDGLNSGGHRVEQEYRPWKGFAIGGCIALPVLILGIFAGCFYEVFSVPYVILAGWAILPITWFGSRPLEEGGGLVASPFYSLLFVLIPIVVSGVMYIVGANIEKRKKEEQAERAERVAALAEQARNNKGKGK